MATVKNKPRPKTSTRWARQTISNMVTGLRNPLNGLTKKQLEKLIEVARDFNTTNCGWSDYMGKGVVIKFAQEEIARLNIIASLKKKGK